MRLKSEILAEPILVGRERELEELQRYLDSAVKGKGTTVFISGEAGSGKTRVSARSAYKSFFLSCFFVVLCFV
jgi:Cdc6-like AAA superfamily ATPase